MEHDEILDRMTRRAETLLELVGPRVRYDLDTPAWRDWTYLPGERAGVAISDMPRTEARATLRLLAAGLPGHAFAQAATIMALEDVLDEADPADRHRGDYWVAVFGDPGAPPWGWRIGGHHLSVRWVIAEDGVARATPQFLGANPARVGDGDSLAVAPLLREEHVAIALVEALDSAQRRAASLPGDVPGDILTGDTSTVDEALDPAGIGLIELGGEAAAQAENLLDVYRSRLLGGLPPDAAEDLRFAWAGSTVQNEPRYYRLQGRSLIVELDNTQDGANHVHTVIRDRHGDLGDDILRAHRSSDHDD